MYGILGLRHTHFPYNIRKMENGKYVILNREYKPLGHRLDGVYSYNEPEHQFALRITPKIASVLSYKGSLDVTNILLYNDGCLPDSSATNWAAYCKRLHRLMLLQTQAYEDEVL